MVIKGKKWILIVIIGKDEGNVFCVNGMNFGNFFLGWFLGLMVVLEV